jgi:FHA domain-containing protein/IPT/TIG domain-containing protein
MPDIPPAIATFTVRGGPLDGQRLDADEAVDEILIGSDTDCRFCLDAPGVSPIHARVWMDLDGVTVHDTHSPRGIYVNDDRVKGQAPLRDRDILWLGAPGDESSVMIECRFGSAAGEAVAGPASMAPPADEGDALADLLPAAPPAVEDALADLVPSESFAAPHPDATLFAMPASAFARPAEPELEELVTSEPEPLIAPEPEPVLEMVSEPEPPPAAAAESDSGFDFFVEETGAGPAPPPPPPAAPAPAAVAAPLDDLLVMDPGPSVAAAGPAAAESAPAEEEAGFFIEDEPAAAPAVPPAPVVPPAAAAPAEPELAEDAFFVEDNPPAVMFDEPVVLDEAPAVAIPPPPAVQPPPVPAAPAPKPAASVPLAAQTQPVEPPPAPKRKPAEAPAPRPAAPRPHAPRAQPAAHSAAPRPSAARARGGLPPAAKYGAIAAAALVVLGGAALLISRSPSAPKLQSVDPSRVAAGQTLTLTGQDFAPQPQGNTVRIEGKPARVLKAAPTELQVEVPDLAAGRPTQVPVTVSVGGRDSAAVQVTIYQTPRIHGVSPSVAMPGEEVTLAGTNWGLGAKVRFGSVEAPVVSATATALRVRVPDGAGTVGASLPVVVTMGADASNSFPFLIGRLPLVTGVEPKTVSAGDLVTIAGRGFHVQPASNTVKIGGAPALVVGSSDADLKAIVPRGAAPGPSAPVEVKVEGLDNVAQSTLTVSPPLDPVDFSFAAEPFVDAAGHQHALLTTGLGPAFVLSDSGGRSAAERALDATRRLGAAAVPLRASRGEDLEVRGVDSDPVIVLMGKSEPILNVTEEDAAAYNEDWTRLGGRGGPVSRGRLALWWGAVGRDLVLMLVRGESPRHAAGLAPEGKVLVDLFDAARQTGRFGVPLSVVESARPGTREALRVVGLRVPASVAGPPPAGGAAAAPAAGTPALTLDGVWTGAETDAEGRKSVTVRFAGNTGSLSYQRALSVSVPLTAVEQPRKGQVRYSVKTAAGTRFYAGRWDGEKITGTIFSDAATTFPIGSFELRSEQ